MARLVAKSLLRCHKNHMMLSANRRPRLKVHSKVIPASNPRASPNSSPEHFRLPLNNSLTTMPQTHSSNAMHTTPTTRNSMDRSKVHRASKMRLHPRDLSVDIMVPSLKELLNFPKAQLNKLLLAMRLLVAKEADIIRLTRLPRLSNKVLAKVDSLNSQATRNNLKAKTTHMVIHITPAHTMLPI